MSGNLLLHLKPDGTRTPFRTGQVPTYTRASIGGALADSNGRVRPTVHSQPKYAMVDLDGDGIRETMGLVMENAQTNACALSENMGGAGWSPYNVTVSPDVVMAPDGLSTADKVLETAVTNAHRLERTMGTTTASTYQTLSAFLKAGERSWAYLMGVRKDGTVTQVWFDLATGVVGTVGAGARGRIEQHADGWYRCIMSYDALTGATANTVGIGAATADAVTSYLGVATSGLYVWGVQLEVDQPYHTSYVKDGGTRADDVLSVPALWPVQDVTMYLAMARQWWHDVGLKTGQTATGLIWGSGLPYLRVVFDASPLVYAYANDDAGAAAVASASVPAGDMIEVCAQFVDVATAVKTRIDVGAGFYGFSTVRGPCHPNTTLKVGCDGTGAFAINAGIVSAKVAAGALTMQQMREAS